MEKKCKYIALHKFLDTGFISIVGFGNDKFILEDMCRNDPHFGSNRHYFLVTFNCTGVFGNEPSAHPVFEGLTMNSVKDTCLLNLCKDVAEYLAVAEFAMLNKYYFTSSVWFDRSKDICSVGSVILNNY